MRGLSGSGKSTVVQILKKNKESRQTFVCASADDFFIDKSTGEFKFDQEKIQLAHSSCKTTVISSLRSKIDIIVVDNTNSKHWEYREHYEAAQKSGYNILIIELQTSEKHIPDLIKRGKGVPLEIVQNMYQRWENTPTELKKIILDVQF